MLWIEAIINISAFAGFIGLANRRPKDEQDELTDQSLALRALLNSLARLLCSCRADGRAQWLMRVAIMTMSTLST